MSIYLDNAATTMVCPEAAEKAMELMQTCYGNPSSLHLAGFEAEKQVKLARKSLSSLLQVQPGQICFTSGGTEGNNMALQGALRRNRARGNVVITSKIEHPSVLRTVQSMEQMGFQVKLVDVDSGGCINIEQFESMLNEQVALVSLMHVNNETGTIQDIAKLAQMVKKNSNALFHTDLVQSFGKIPFKITQDIDMATISGHKIHAPKGVGALYLKDPRDCLPLIWGGGQEKNMRSGTENTPGICAFGVAATLAVQTGTTQIEQVKQKLKAGIENTIKDITFNGENTSPYLLNVSFLGVRAEVLLHTLESHGIMVSSGSACSSNHPMPSPTLTAMGCTKEQIDGAVRFSFSRYTTLDEVETCCQVLQREVPLLRKFRMKA